jgi:hypothetical protein
MVSQVFGSDYNGAGAGLFTFLESFSQGMHWLLFAFLQREIQAFSVESVRCKNVRLCNDVCAL